jgi:2-keto-4-pentenoate hydratase/2-oxohepta-3-ene-1,7-dioic acid hydratase in catechol pathway
MVQWARFRSNDGRDGFGIFEEGHIVEYEGDLFDSPRPAGRTIPMNACTLRSPCTPSKMVALWNNFHALAAKLGKQAPAHPLFLLKPGTSVIGPGDPIRRVRRNPIAKIVCAHVKDDISDARDPEDIAIETLRQNLPER